ncbi:hypothetical protein BDP55DRAFT_647975 [Colletotrichum godetiae]|uniref:Uncharacterized protein n=1 Tax=Colletotrichum godetiae TaxID=1209918 RepID=A0AAJ0AUK9_9PEZI|nr:uncharacterized protein BDP55DRAFT_647975 [Colletotrichum godetiae]KAK1690644.1 hypothetical protein BDP55DRAFT_647975 [Colletotrichum godetiae]
MTFLPFFYLITTGGEGKDRKPGIFVMRFFTEHNYLSISVSHFFHANRKKKEHTKKDITRTETKWNEKTLLWNFFSIYTTLGGITMIPKFPF